MPLEVRQIGIRLRVAEPGEAGAREASPLAPPPRVQRLQAGRERARLIEDCTQAVLAALQRAADY